MISHTRSEEVARDIIKPPPRQGKPCPFSISLYYKTVGREKISVVEGRNGDYLMIKLKRNIKILFLGLNKKVMIPRIIYIDYN